MPGFPCYYQTRFPKSIFLIADRTLAGMVVSLRNGVFEPARRPPANSITLHSPDSAVQEFCCRYSRFRCSVFRVGSFGSDQKNTWSKSKKE
jgi:hypothetical protein